MIAKVLIDCTVVKRNTDTSGKLVGVDVDANDEIASVIVS